MFTEELEGVQFYISRYQRDGRPLYLRFFPGRSPRFGRSAQRGGQTGESAVAKPGNFVPGGRRGPTGQPYAPAPAWGGSVPRPLADPRGEFAPRRYRVRRARLVAWTEVEAFVGVGVGEPPCLRRRR